MISLRLNMVYSLVAVFGLCLIVSGVPVIDVSKFNVSSQTSPVLSSEELIDLSAENNSTNGTHKDLYVIKAVVYEIGILTEVADDDNSTEEDYSHERVDLTFFDAHSNGSHLDLGDIPLPVQTNVSGQVLTGIAPIHIGAIQNASDLFGTLPLTGTIVNIAHSDTSFITLSHAPTMGENGSTILDAADLAKIPGLNSQPILIDNTLHQLQVDENLSSEEKTTTSSPNVL